MVQGGRGGGLLQPLPWVFVVLQYLGNILLLGADHLTSEGEVGCFGLVMNFFFNTLIHYNFFFSSMRLHVIFFALQHSAGIFFCVDGVEKGGIPLLLLATLTAVLFNSNTGSILAFVRLFHSPDVFV